MNKIFNQINQTMMKKLLLILPLFFFAVAINAQQTEDEVHVGSYPKGKTFGNYKGTSIIIPDVDKTAKSVTILSGIVVRSRTVTGGDADSLTRKDGGGLNSFDLKLDDGSVIKIGTNDFGFNVPPEIIGHRISLEAVTPASLISGRERKTVRKNYQQDIEYAAIGLLVLN
jgi:hypothetical protein